MLKKFFLSLGGLTTAVAVLPVLTPVHAGDHVKVILDSHPVTKALKASGTQVVYKAKCKTDYLGKAIFTGNKNAIVMCLNNINGDSTTAIETLKHEAVHTAQYCWHGEYTNLYEIKEWKKIAKEKGHDITYADKMSEGDESEWEAYYLEDAHDKDIIDLVKDNCNNDEINKDIEKA